MSEVPLSAPRKLGRVQVGWLVRLAVSAVVLTIIFRLVPIQEVWREAQRLSPALWAGGVVVFLLAPFGAKPAQVIAVGLIWQTVLYASGLIGLLAQVAWKPAASANQPAPTQAAITESST